MPVWAHQKWWRDNEAIHEPHYVIVSREKPGLLAYYQSPEKACLGIRTQIRPGRYLARYFGGILTEAERAKMARWQETGVLETDYADPVKYPMAFARTRQEIREVYEHGPDSCMAGGNSWESDAHPCEVYAAGDLAVAYLYNPDNDNAIRARALVWPAKKTFGRVYPTEAVWQSDGFASSEDALAMQNALRNRLLSDGYTDCLRSAFTGARLLRIELDDNKVVMPYLDGGYGVDDDDEHFVMTSRSGTYSCDSTGGYITVEDGRPRCDRCNDPMDEDETFTVYTRASSSGGQWRGIMVRALLQSPHLHLRRLRGNIQRPRFSYRCRRLHLHAGLRRGAPHLLELLR